jgi:CRISPR-associated endonuclease Csn1
MLRRSWGLNSLLPDHNFGCGADQPKNRLDHRHHAIDALVIAVTDRGLLQRISREAGQRGHEEARRLTADLPPPWGETHDTFREDVRAAVGKVVASHRPDHGTASKATLTKGQDATAGRLHNDTAYGLTGVQENGVDLVVHRIPLASLKPDDLVDGGRRVADPTLRDALAVATAGSEGKAFAQALNRFADTHPQFQGIRRVRVLEPLSVIPIRDKKGRAYKGYKGDANYRCDVWRLKTGRWTLEVVSMFDAHRPDWRSPIRQAEPTALKVMTLIGGDIIALDGEHGAELLRVVALDPGRLQFAACNEGGKLKDRHKSESDPFRYAFIGASTLQKRNARQVRLDELGRVQDPGRTRCLRRSRRV